MIGYVTCGPNTFDEAARSCIRDVDGQQLNAIYMHEHGS